jgi:hypothetical protein
MKFQKHNNLLPVTPANKQAKKSEAMKSLQLLWNIGPATA